MWQLLDEDGLVAESRWPEPLRDVDDYRIERQVVRRTLDDVRDITEVVDIDEPNEIELVVAADWKSAPTKSPASLTPTTPSSAKSWPTRVSSSTATRPPSSPTAWPTAGRASTDYRRRARTRYAPAGRVAVRRRVRLRCRRSAGRA